MAAEERRLLLRDAAGVVYCCCRPQFLLSLAPGVQESCRVCRGGVLSGCQIPHLALFLYFMLLFRFRQYIFVLFT